MRANVWSGRNTVQVENVPDPKILNERDAIVRITSTAICGSDLHLYDGYVPTMKHGDILGHEFMGEIVETGRGVENLQVGDRVVVPFPIACGDCWACKHKLYSVCENSNPNAGIAEKAFGHSTAGMFGYAHLTGGYAGGQAEYARVPFADVGPIKIEDDLPDEQVLFLSDIFPTGFMGADFCEISGGEVVAVFGAGPVGQFAMASAVMLGAERVIAIDQLDYRLQMARNKAGATDTINFMEDADIVEQFKELTGGRGPDAVIDAVGDGGRARSRRRAHGRPGQAGDALGVRPRPCAARRDPVVPAGRHRVGDRCVRRADGQVPDRSVHEQGPDAEDGAAARAEIPRAALRAQPQGRHRPELRDRAPPPARGGAERLRDLQAQAGRVREGRPQALGGTSRMPFPPRPVDATLHGVVDYAAGTTLLTVFPTIAGIEGTRSAGQIRTAAAIHAGYSTLTDYPLGAVKLIPFQAHLAMVAVGAVALAATPFVTGQWKKGVSQWLPHVGLALFELASLVITDPTGRGDWHGDVEAVRRSDMEEPGSKTHEGGRAVPPAVA